MQQLVNSQFLFGNKIVSFPLILYAEANAHNLNDSHLQMIYKNKLLMHTSP